MAMDRFKLSAAILSLAVIWACCGRNAFAGPGADLNPRAQTAFLTGTADLKKGDIHSAVTEFQEVLRIDKTFGPAYLNLGLAYNELNQYERAILSFTKALELDAGLEGAALFLGIDYYKTGAPEKAIGPLQKALELTPGDPDAHLWLGKAYLAVGRYQEAIPHIEKASQAYPKDIGLQFDLAHAHLLLSDELTTRIYNQNPHTYWPHLLKAQAYGLEGKLDLASIEYNQVLKLNPKLPGVHEALGEISAKKRDYPTAEAEFQKELDINPYDFMAKCSLADALIESGQASEAIPAIEETAAQKPSLGCAQYELGRAWFRQGQYEKAEGHLEAATVLNPTYAPAYVLLGQCYAKLGKSVKAQAAFEKSRALDAEHLERMQQNIAPSEPLDQLNPQ
ncbi:MAG TPA: tetratricopeptide repeat protein [Terriglobia bacterium]|nr:tetratricopeptide repeat protein [Terriglobia bacterium]